VNLKPAEIQKQVQRCTAVLRERGMRRTRALELVIQELASHGKPMTIADLAATATLKEQCDPATVYRLVMKLEEHGLVRRLGLHVRSGYFLLIIPGEHHDYLVCTGCGDIQEIDMACPVHDLEAKLARQTGYQQVYHELEFFGTCPVCVKAAG
jgi:Fur family ferric uptake transcriptional regulator